MACNFLSQIQSLIRPASVRTSEGYHCDDDYYKIYFPPGYPPPPPLPLLLLGPRQKLMLQLVQKGRLLWGRPGREMEQLSCSYRDSCRVLHCNLDLKGLPVFRQYKGSGSFVYSLGL